MPELPDLLYIKDRLTRALAGRTVTSMGVLQSVVVRNMLDIPLHQLIPGRTVESVDQRGPFLRIGLSGELDMIMNLMLAGKLQHQRPGEKPEGYICVSWLLDDGSTLHLCDEQKMAKLYIARRSETGGIPKYGKLGIDILSPEFTLDRFRVIAGANSRKQIRVMINDHTLLSAIGNAYADEILFEARIHPKTFVARLSGEETTRLYEAIRNVMTWGIRKVEEAGQPIHVKVRDHMKVRNRKGEPCPRCGGTIRREGVHGHDVFFCPTCQPASRKLFIDWRTVPPAKP